MIEMRFLQLITYLVYNGSNATRDKKNYCL